MTPQRDLFQSDPVQLARMHAAQFPDDFLEWLPANLAVYSRFKAEAFKIRSKGFDHYSARTIIEFMRHHTAINETASDWKLNNNHPPYLARLFDLDCPEAKGLFEYRETKKVVSI